MPVEGATELLERCASGLEMTCALLVCHHVALIVGSGLSFNNQLTFSRLIPHPHVKPVRPPPPPKPPPHPPVLSCHPA